MFKNNLPSPEKIIMAFVSLIILGMVAFSFSDSFKSVTSLSKSGNSEIKSANLQRDKDVSLNDGKSINSASDDLTSDENTNEKNDKLSKIKKMFNKNEDENKNKIMVSSDIYSELIRAYNAINKALEKEYKLYGNKTRINGQSISKDKLIQMLKNQMTVIEFDDFNVILTGPNAETRLQTEVFEYGVILTSEGIYQPWNTDYEVGFNIRTQMLSDNWRAAIYCSNASECEKMNPNVFSIKNNCGKDNDYRLCPADNVGYSLIYKKPIKQVFDMFPDNYPAYDI